MLPVIIGLGLAAGGIFGVKKYKQHKASGGKLMGKKKVSKKPIPASTVASADAALQAALATGTPVQQIPEHANAVAAIQAGSTTSAELVKNAIAIEASANQFQASGNPALQAQVPILKAQAQGLRAKADQLNRASIDASIAAVAAGSAQHGVER